MTTTPPETLTLEELATFIGVSRRTMYNMINDRRFYVLPIKGTHPRRWNPDHVKAWKDAQ